jgi:hypothetical protein
VMYPEMLSSKDYSKYIKDPFKVWCMPTWIKK